MEGPVPEERRVNGGPEVNIIAPVPVWALKRHHDYIQWTAVGGVRDLEVIVDSVSYTHMTLPTKRIV